MVLKQADHKFCSVNVTIYNVTLSYSTVTRLACIE